jgi:hypothetical protein
LGGDAGNTTEERIGCDVFRGRENGTNESRETEFGDVAGVSSMKEAKDRIRYSLCLRKDADALDDQQMSPGSPR